MLLHVDNVTKSYPGSAGRPVLRGVSLGPIVMGLKKPCYVLTNSATVRRVVNMTALAVVEAQVRARQLTEG